MLNDDPAPPGFTGPLKLAANEGGWVWNAVLGHVPVGAEVDAPDAPEFIADGFHFVDAATGEGDVCAGEGGGCWCGQHRGADPRGGIRTDPDPADVIAAPSPPAVTPNLSDLLGNGAK